MTDPRYSARNKTFFAEFDHRHPAGDVLWVFVEPGNVVP